MPVGFNAPLLQYEHPDLGDDPRPDPTAQARVDLVQRVGEVLYGLFPGHPWRIQVPPAPPGEETIIQISIPPLMGPSLCMVIYTDHVKNFSDLYRLVMHRAGEILEMYNLPRQNFSADHYLCALQATPHWMRR